MNESVNLFIGFDRAQPRMSWVFARSVLARASIPVHMTFLFRPMLEKAMLYLRPKRADESTEFTFSRFLAPSLAGDWVLFCDGDMLCLDDIAQLWALRDDDYAVMCVHHPEYNPAPIKMVGKAQTSHPRKNWSSVMLINCRHPATSNLDAQYVANASPAELHQFTWAEGAVGEIPPRWNHLVGYTDTVSPPGIVHFTDGGPWLPGFEDVPFAQEWREEARMMGISVSTGEHGNERSGHSEEPYSP